MAHQRRRLWGSHAGDRLGILIRSIRADMPPTSSSAIRDPGYDWRAPSAQGEDTLTPEVRRVAGEILGDEEPETHGAGRVGCIRRRLRRILVIKRETIFLKLPPE